MISFTHSRLYKDIASKAFFTMATFLMPLLENGNFSPGKNLARGEITISPRVTSAHDDFTENFFGALFNFWRNGNKSTAQC